MNTLVSRHYVWSNLLLWQQISIRKLCGDWIEWELTWPCWAWQLAALLSWIVNKLYVPWPELKPVCSVFQFYFLKSGPWTGKFHFKNVKPLIRSVNIAILKFRLVHVNVYMPWLWCEGDRMKRVTCKCIFCSKQKITQYKRKFARNIAKCREIPLKLSECHEISLEFSRSAA